MISEEQMQLVNALSTVVKHSADLMGKVVRWAIVSDEDKDYFRQDVENLRDEVADILLLF